MTWTIKPRRLPIDYIVIHWTGGTFEAPYTQTFNTLANRGLSIDAIVQDNGKRWVRADLKTNYSLHAGSLINRRALGIETACPGTRFPEKYPDRQKHAGYYLFSDAAIEELALTCYEWCSAHNLPFRVLTNSDYVGWANLRKSKFRGIIGHYHVSTKGKCDPGVRNLERLAEFDFELAKFEKVII